jgi:hypothetical protein
MALDGVRRRFDRALGARVGRAAALARPRVARAVMRDRRGRTGTDVEHLDAAMLWLRDAQAAVPGGVAARYDLARGWQSAYPETSGYIVGTLLHHAELFTRPGESMRARAIGDWLLEIQDRGGFIPGGLVDETGTAGHRPSVFNTGQVVFGLLALAEGADGQRFAEAARRACTWLVGEQEDSGAWVRSSLHGVPRSYYARVAWALARAGVVLDEPAFAAAARRSVTWVCEGSRGDGWIEHMSFNQGKPALTHTIAYTIEGLLETSLVLPGLEWAFDVAWRAARAVRDVWESEPAARRDGDIVALFDAGWIPAARFACVTGSAQLALCCSRLDAMAGDPRLAAFGNQLLDCAKRSQPLTGAVGVRGGVPGSAPLWGSYGSFCYLNWAAKFLADALLQRVSGGLGERRYG